MQSIQRFSHRHPILIEALLWTVPALLFGLVLRVLLISYLPYVLWNPDSRSYYVFAQKLFQNGWISMGEKRRFLYPLLMVPVSLLPGGALRWLAVFQHAFGLITLVPLAYAVRKTLVCWRLWIIPITVIYAGLPIIVWCEHLLLGDTVFFAMLVWTFGGWMSWVGEPRPERARRLFWLFLVPFALFILTKPSGRFVWPGLFLGFIALRSWRVLRWPQWTALFLVLAVTPFVGSKKQGAWLLYDATFPLTQLDTPLHAEYKAEIRPWVEQLRSQLDLYYFLQADAPFYFLRDPGVRAQTPLWKALGSDEKLQSKIYLDLAIEGIKARPDLFLYLGGSRIVAAANVSEFSANHFSDGHFIDKTTEFYAEAQESEDSPVRLAFALPGKGPIPAYADFQRRLEPAPGSWRAHTVQACVRAYGTKLDFFRFPDLPRKECKIGLVRATLLGWWLVVGACCALLPRYRSTLGVWTVTAAGYLFGVFLFSVVHVHYFAPAWPVLLLLLALPLDALGAAFLRRAESLGSRNTR